MPVARQKKAGTNQPQLCELHWYFGWVHSEVPWLQKWKPHEGFCQKVCYTHTQYSTQRKKISLLVDSSESAIFVPQWQSALDDLLVAQQYVRQNLFPGTQALHQQSYDELHHYPTRAFKSSAHQLEHQQSVKHSLADSQDHYLYPTQTIGISAQS